MRYLGILVVVSACCLVLAASGGDMKGVMEYRLLLENGPYARGQVMPCRLLMRNNTDALRKIGRPNAAEIAIRAVGPDGTDYQAIWQDDAMGRREAEEVALKPGCELDTPLGSFILQDNQGKISGLPIGRYSISGVWARHGRGAEATPEITGKQEVAVVEFPFRIRLDAGHYRYAPKQPVKVQISMENRGSVPVRLLNYFYPHENHFAIVLKRRGDERDGKPAVSPNLLPPRELAAITPNAGTGWITLRPGESLRVQFDAADYLKEEGLYSLQVAYQRPILILDPKTGPRYTEQHWWESDTIELDVVAKKQ